MGHVTCDNPSNATNLEVHDVNFQQEYNISDILKVTSSFGVDNDLYIMVINKQQYDNKYKYTFTTLNEGTVSPKDLTDTNFQVIT